MLVLHLQPAAGLVTRCSSTHMVQKTKISIAMSCSFSIIATSVGVIYERSLAPVQNEGTHSSSAVQAYFARGLQCTMGTGGSRFAHRGCACGVRAMQS